MHILGVKPGSNLCPYNYAELKSKILVLRKSNQKNGLVSPFGLTVFFFFAPSFVEGAWIKGHDVLLLLFLGQNIFKSLLKAQP